MSESGLHIEQALHLAAQTVGGLIRSKTQHGWNRKSAGARVELRDGRDVWLRVHVRKEGEQPNKLWSGTAEAAKILGVRKPAVFEVHDISDSGVIVRAEMTEFVAEKPCSSTPELRERIVLTRQWLDDLDRSLKALDAVETERVAIRQDLVTRRISEMFGPHVPCQVHNWGTIHGDVHWANVTAPDLWLLDWEGWGKGPRGIDVCFLYCFSLLVPDVAKRLDEYFHGFLTSCDGRLGQLFVCAELIRMVDKYNDHPDLKGKLSELSKRLLEDGRA